MKKLLLCLCAIALLGCKETPGTNEQFCWDFRTTQVTTITGVSISGYPKTVNSTTTKCGLTEAQANEVVKLITTTTSSTVQGIKATVETTCTKTKRNQRAD